MRYELRARIAAELLSGVVAGYGDNTYDESAACDEAVRLMEKLFVRLGASPL